MTLKNYLKENEDKKLLITVFDFRQKPINDSESIPKLKRRRSLMNREIRKIFELPNNQVDIYLKW